MTTPTWHLGRAKFVLNEWYDRIPYWQDAAEQWEKLTRLPWNRKEAGKCKKQVLKCKTLGLVWHDRYKMLLDVRRN